MEAPPDEPPGRVPPSTPQVLAPLPLPSTLPFSARLRDAPVTVVDEKSQVSLVLPALGVRVEVERLLADRAWIRCTGCRTESAGWVQRNLLLAGRPESSRRADALVAFLEQTAHPADDFDPTKKDGLSTKGLSPEKTNWALKLDKPPYVAYACTGGITFSFGGLKINERAQVIGTDWNPIPGLYTCGEMVGNLFHYNYPGGTGLMSGAVFGRIAGGNAAGE